MRRQIPDIFDSSEDPFEDDKETSEQDLWFLPGPIEQDPDDLPPGPRAGPDETSIIADWAQAEAGLAARLARVAGRLGALDDRLRRGPEGWRHRLALIEAADLSWAAGDRISPDRLALWTALRLSGVQDDAGALARVGWAVRRLTGGPGPVAGLADFLGRHDPETVELEADRLQDRAAGWLDLMAAAGDLHPITRAGMGFHLWGLAGLGPHGDRMEAAVTAGRIAASDGQGAVFAPLAMGGAGGLRATGPAPDRLAGWLDGMERALLTALRHLDDIEAWSARAQTVMTPLSGRTPPALRGVLTEWPLVSAPMAERLTGASRAAVQRNLAWMEAQGLIREVTGQGRFRMWRAVP
ncbi:HTH DNA binding domain-containing protein [Thalassovita gelatinovora]|uniref:hypothetical protein n=1 Tax=Thalassovita gelatinovora TaxID=53501 RepID=UPI0008C6ACEA|nr:hypothetical protein [Thalassovita gelatinovora]QIZ82695.1 hypothetical protein HFZ77_19190 [Thalassovita gelatinovora]SER12089.1 HTH DNA binding domain-containing protein [Thalassovita gelatinovora]